MPPFAPGRSLILIGFKSCGKTTVGRLLAGRLGRRFIDLDAELEDEYARRAGRRLGFRDIYREAGAEAFRALERDVARALRDGALGAGAAVVSPGGGAVGDPAIRALLREAGTVIHLRVPFDETLRRIRRDGYPAYLKTDDPEGELRRLYDEREPLYRAAAEIVIEAGDAPPDVVCERILAQICRKKTPGSPATG